MCVNLGVSFTKQPLGNMQDRPKGIPWRERGCFPVLVCTQSLESTGCRSLRTNSLLQRSTCLGRSSSISSCAILSILRYRGRFLAFSSIVRTSGEGCVFTSHQLVPRKGLCTSQMGTRPRGDPDLGGGWQKMWVAIKRPTKKCTRCCF